MMDRLICEIIPCETFKERIRVTQNELNKGLCPENLDKLIAVHYNKIKEEKQWKQH